MQQLGKYQLIERIGVGGFGEVFKGFDPYIKRHVAVKTCSSNSEEIRSRFFQEAEIAGNLHHRNITTVYDFGVEGELPYLIQEYLSGEDLDVKIRRKDYLPFAEKLFYLIQIARGLSAAHAQGVMHRDIKPANVRVLDDGTVKIMDFGIAKLAQQQTGLTQTGMTLGTAAYLSPEQIRGDAMDVRTDIFSFGVLAYELLAYERPFQGEQISAVLYQLLNNDPRPLSEWWPDAPPEIVELLDCCLQKSPARRYQNGGELLKALETIQRRGRERSDIYRRDKKPKVEPPTVLLDSGAAAATRAPTPPQRRGLDDIDLTGANPTLDAEPALSHAAPPSRNAPQRGSDRPSLALPILVAVLLAIVAGGVGWWLGNRGDDAPVGERPGVDAVAADGSPAVEDVAPRDGTRAPSPSTPSGSISEGTADGSKAGSASPEAPAETPPVIAQGRILVKPPFWTEKMTVKLGSRGQAWPLTTMRSFGLDPGSYSLSFSLQDGDYQAEKTLRVRVESGQDHTIDPPIPQPSALTVRASPGRPQGDVFLRGQLLSSSPLRRHVLAPGAYTVEIRPRSDAAPLIQNVELEPGKETIVTFDLAASTLRKSSKPLR